MGKKGCPDELVDTFGKYMTISVGNITQWPRKILPPVCALRWGVQALDPEWMKLPNV